MLLPQRRNRHTQVGDGPPQAEGFLSVPAPDTHLTFAAYAPRRTFRHSVFVGMRYAFLCI